MMETPFLDRYQRLREITLDLASTLDLGVLLNRIARAAADLSGAQAASILLYDEDKQEMRFEAATNLEELAMRGLVIPVEGSIAGLVVQTRQPVIIPDVPEDPRHYTQGEQALHSQTRSLLMVPMITKNKVIGVLESLNKREGQFSSEDQEMLCALGAQAAVAIENARLFQQSDLISELIHELRTPLTSINTAAALLLRSEIPAEQRRQMVDVIQSETTRLSEMASSFLDLARLESGRAQFQADTIELGALLEEAANLMNNRAREKGLKLTLKLPEKLPPLFADRNKLKQVLLNLLSNAIKYNRPEGTIKLTGFAGQKEIGFSVQDTGVGIGEESLSHLFEKFYRVPGTEGMAPGTGLGLSICKRIVEAHGGKIEVESLPGVGTTFTVRLPLKDNF